MKPYYYFWFSLLACLIYSCGQEKKDQLALELIRETKEKFAPDQRVAIFDIQFAEDSLWGETNLPEAHDALTRSFKTNDIDYIDGIHLLPEEELGAQTLALVTNSVANLRSEAKHSAELSTQALLGTPLKVYKKMGSWYQVQTPDRYIAWVDAAAIQLLDQEKMNEWVEKPKLVVTEMFSSVYEDLSFEAKVSDLTAGNVLELLNESEGDYHVQLPDGRSGYVSKTDALPYEIWKNTRNTEEESLVKTAKSMMGVPYLWGGTSTKGVDCSGFTKTIYFLNGMIIPRDASQQIREGEEVDHEKNWDKLEIGDLLFFGVPASDSTAERVIHVGMWIGNRSFIHSSGRVRVSSFDPNDENYDEYEFNRYLRTKRIKDSPSENILAVENMLQ